MATAAFVEESHRRSSLGVSKSSARIGKIKRHGAAGASNQRPPPTIYKTEPEGFRSLVQELTGPSPSTSFLGAPQQTIQQQQQQQQSRSNRLHNLAPPPLSAPSSAAFKPSFYTPSMSPKFDFGSFSSAAMAALSPKFAPFSPLSFSPLADLTPRDALWASGLESPGTAEIKTLAQLVAGDDHDSSSAPPLPSPSKLERAGSFTFSPKFSTSSGFGSSFNFGFNSSDFSFSSM